MRRSPVEQWLVFYLQQARKGLFTHIYPELQVSNLNRVLEGWLSAITAHTGTIEPARNIMGACLFIVSITPMALEPQGAALTLLCNYARGQLQMSDDEYIVVSGDIFQTPTVILKLVT